MSDGEERSIGANERYAQSRERFDYFVTGAAGALCAYTAQNLEPVRLGANPPTLEVVALLAMVGAVVAGVRQMEVLVQVLVGNHMNLHHLEIAGKLASGSKQHAHMINSQGELLSSAEAAHQPADHRAQAKRALDLSEPFRVRAHSMYRWRNRLLLGGFLLLVAARVWAPYTR
jgi:hypothetical protein